MEKEATKNVNDIGENATPDLKDVKKSLLEKDKIENKKETRGRKSKKSKDEEILQSFLGTSKSLIDACFDFLSQRHGDYWKLSDSESKNISIASDKLLIKYIPFLKNYGVEVSFLLISVGIVAPRIIKTMKSNKEIKKITVKTIKKDAK